MIVATMIGPIADGLVQGAKAVRENASASDSDILQRI